MSYFYDVVIKNGEVVDPAGGNSGKLDVATKAGRIAAVERFIPAKAARRLIDAQDKLVLPGLVDSHSHVYAGSTYWGINPDALSWRTGVTTWVDAGSAGAYNIGGLRRLAHDVAPTVQAFINISAIGLVGETGELRDLSICDSDLCAQAVSREAGFVVGVKARMSKRSIGESGIEPLKRALSAAEMSGTPVMVHIGASPPSLDEVVRLLRPGDILTHCACDGDMSLVGPDGNVMDYVRRAVESGVILDLGHGSGSFSFPVAEAMIAQGFAPRIISSDIHARSVYGPVFDLPTCMSKMLSLGMSLTDVVKAATAEPARALGLSSGTGSLSIGASADVAIFSLERGQFNFYDVNGASRAGTQMLQNTLTMVAGVELEPRIDEPPLPWIDVPERALVDRTANLRRSLSLEGLTPADFPSSGRIQPSKIKG